MTGTASLIAKQHLIDPEICIRCNTCETLCPVGAITHDATNYVVDPNLCDWCNDCIASCPTGSIDNYRNMPRLRFYSLQEQFGWDSLPAELPRQQLLALAAATVAAATTAAAATAKNADAPHDR